MSLNWEMAMTEAINNVNSTMGDLQVVQASMADTINQSLAYVYGLESDHLSGDSNEQNLLLEFYNAMKNEDTTALDALEKANPDFIYHTKTKYDDYYFDVSGNAQGQTTAGDGFGYEEESNIGGVSGQLSQQFQSDSQVYGNLQSGISQDAQDDQSAVQTAAQAQQNNNQVENSLVSNNMTAQMEVGLS